MKKTTKLSALTLALITAASLSACANDTVLDNEDAPVKDANVVVFNNIDGHPNIARVCADGVAFATTTREYGDAVTRVPEWDEFCGDASSDVG